MIKRILRNKKGLTLVEVLAALVLTFILMATLGSLLLPVTSLYRNSESKVIMDTVGQKLLDELAYSTAASNDLILYNSTNPSVSGDVDFKIYLYNGYIYKRKRTGENIHILVSDKSYQECTVVSLDFFADKINEAKSYEDPTMGNYVRIIYARIKLKRNNVESDYMITTVKIYNFSMSGDEIYDYRNTLAVTTLNPHTASSGYKSLIITPYI